MPDDDTLTDQTEERFAANLREARDRAGLSQDALAARMRDLGYPFRQQTIAKIEGGLRSVRLGEADALARSVDADLGALCRPRGLAQFASRLLWATRKTREAERAIADSSESLTKARTHLQWAIAVAEENGVTGQLVDEMYIARLALRETAEGAQ